MQLELLNTELLQFEFSMKKIEKMIAVAQQEMSYYKSEHVRLGKIVYKPEHSTHSTSR